jgi:hypothetical protein
VAVKRYLPAAASRPPHHGAPSRLSVKATEAGLEGIEQQGETAELTPRVRLDHPNFTREMLEPHATIAGLGRRAVTWKCGF